MIIDVIVDFWVAALAAVGFMTAIFALAQWRDRYDLVDIGWGLGFIVVTTLSYVLAGIAGTRSTILLVMVGIWGTRLALHITRRLTTHPEDRRYQAMRQKWEGHVTSSMFTNVYLVQAMMLVVIASPIVVINSTNSVPLTWLDAVAIGLWVIGFYWESVGDRQLTKFLAVPANKGKLMTGGLWKYSRHPNYFGELLQWWSIGLLACSIPFGWLALVGPLTLTFLILKVSGVPLLERSYAGRPDWEMYKTRTSPLIPWLPKKGQTL